jgi:voltage-gated potassium channel
VNFYNNLTCVVFLIDFALHMIRQPRKRDYFIGQRGYLDLLGSIPNFGISQYTAILRIFRVSRLLRLRRLMNPANRELLKKEILENRGSYALFITLMLVLVVLTTSSIFVLFFESQSPDANITNGGNAVWWAVVTITTVGYGDRYPVTLGGRLVAVFVMFSGVGIIGALASILASILVPQPKEEAEDEKNAPPTAVEQELTAVKNELAALRHLLEKKESG